MVTKADLVVCCHKSTNTPRNANDRVFKEIVLLHVSVCCLTAMLAENLVNHWIDINKRLRK